MAGGSLKQPIRMKVSSPRTGVGDVSAAIVTLGISTSMLEVFEMAGIAGMSASSVRVMVDGETGCIIFLCAVVISGSTRHAIT